jgi:type II secretory pathway pseudopilin PulG
MKALNESGNALADVRMNEAGFSLLEAVMSTVILLITLLGVSSVFTFAIAYNTGNNRRSQALSVLQREVELVRSYKFTPAVTDTSLQAGQKAPKTSTSSDGSNYTVEIKVDDDPFTDGIQIDTAKTLKEITITVTPAEQVDSWQTAVPTSLIIRRTRGN